MAKLGLRASMGHQETCGVEMREAIKVFKALGDPNRIKILKLLEKKEMCVCEIQELLRISQPAVSKHLKVLEEADLVGFRKEGMWVNYYLKENSPNPYARSLLGHMKEWLNQDQEIAHLRSLAPFVNRDQIRCRQRQGRCSY